MAVEAAGLGKLVADFMEKIESEFGDEASLGVFAVIAEVNGPPDEDGEPGWTAINYSCSDNRRWLQAGLFTAGLRAVYESAQQIDIDEGE